MAENAEELNKQLFTSAMNLAIRELQKEDQSPKMIQALASLINALQQY